MYDFDGERTDLAVRAGHSGDERVVTSREEAERRRDRWRFLLVLFGALAGGSLAFGVVQATMGWLPDPGPMLPFSTFAGALLGLFSAAFVGAHVIGDQEERVEARSMEWATNERELSESPETRDVAPDSGAPSPFRDDLALPSWVLDVHRIGLRRRSGLSA